jgi:hypothetical protein
MSHRQTRIEQAAEGSFPFWVALVEEKCTGANYDKHRNFCKAHGLTLSRHGHSVVWQREWYCVFRFADQEQSYRQILVTAGPVRRRRLWADGQRV